MKGGKGGGGGGGGGGVTILRLRLWCSNRSLNLPLPRYPRQILWQNSACSLNGTE